MRKTETLHGSMRILYGIAALVIAAAVMLFCDSLAFVSSAAGQGKVTKSSVNIRKEANTTSDVVGSAGNGETLTINSEVQDASGTVWYQVTKDGVTGYIRSDLMQKTESDGNSGGSQSVNPTVTVTQVQPVEAKVTGSDKVRVRTDASTAGGIITTADRDTAVTVKGQATGADNMTWYLVIFNGNGGTVEGFIRSDYLNLSGEVVPADTDEPAEEQNPEADEPQQTEEPKEQKLYDTQLKDDGVWYLQDYTRDEEWDVAKLIDEYQKNAMELNSVKKSVKTQKIVIIIMVVLLIAAVLTATMLYFKVKDISDEAYFAAVEKETLKERNAMKANSSRGSTAPSRKVMQTVGTEAPRTSRPAQPRQAEGQARPVQRAGQPQQSGAGQGRVVQNGGQSRPSVSGNMAQKPAQSRQVEGQARPVQARPGQAAGTRPVQNAQAPSGQPRPAQTRPAQPAQTRPAQTSAPAQNLKNKPMAEDDDEFEFEFLNWDGEEK